MSTWSKTVTLQVCRECCGGQGFSSYNKIGTMKNDSEVDMTYEGDNHVLLQQVARALLTGLQKGRYTIPPTVYGVDKSKITTREFLLGALHWRVGMLLEKTSARMIHSMGSGKNTEQAWNGCLDVITDVSKAKVEAHCLSTFYATIDRAEAGLRIPLTLLANLFGLWSIHCDLGTFVINNGINREAALIIQDEINDLLHAIHPYALDIVDCIPIPDYLLVAPIAFDYVARNAYGRDLADM